MLFLVADRQKAVARVFLDDFAVRQVDSFGALVLAEVEDRLLFAAAKCDLLGV